MQVEDRTECRESSAVSYKRDVANVLALEIDPAAATNKEELEEYKVHHLAPAITCLVLSDTHPSWGTHSDRWAGGRDCSTLLDAFLYRDSHTGTWPGRRGWRRRSA